MMHKKHSRVSAGLLTQPVRQQITNLSAGLGKNGEARMYTSHMPEA